MKRISLGIVLIILASSLLVTGCGEGSPTVPDSDGDGWTDAQEQSAGTNPYSVDTDGDGQWDPHDPNPLDPSVPVDIATPTPNPTFTPWFNPTFTPMPTPTPSPTPSPTPTPTPTPIPVGPLIEVQSYRWGKGYGMSIGGEDDFLFVEGSARNVGTETLEVVVVMNCWSSRTLVKSEEGVIGSEILGLTIYDQVIPGASFEFEVRTAYDPSIDNVTVEFKDSSGHAIPQI